MSDTLNGVRILDLTHVLAGPFATMILADMGAEVIKIEPPGGGDITRSLGPPFLGGVSTYFLSLNRNKRSVAIDIKTPVGQALFLSLVEKADVVIENFRPGVMKELGIGPEVCRARRPGLITCSVSGFGSNGPYAHRPSFDLIVQAMGGGMSITGLAGQDPARCGVPIGDLGGGLFAAIAVCGALFRRQITGEGQHIDLSLLDAEVSMLTYIAQNFMADGVVPEPVGSGHPTIVPYQAFPTADGHIVVAVFGDRFWGPFCAALGLDYLVDRYPTNADRRADRRQLIELLSAPFLSQSSDYWLAVLESHGVPAGPVLTVAEVLEDPQIRAREMVTRVNRAHPSAGKHEILGNPIRVGDAERFEPAPLLGEHTRVVLTELLGCTGDEVDRLFESKIVG